MIVYPVGHVACVYLQAPRSNSLRAKRYTHIIQHTAQQQSLRIWIGGGGEGGGQLGERENIHNRGGHQIPSSSFSRKFKSPRHTAKGVIDYKIQLLRNTV